MQWWRAAVYAVLQEEELQQAENASVDVRDNP
jgi:hypothetical protein